MKALPPSLPSLLRPGGSVYLPSAVLRGRVRATNPVLNELLRPPGRPSTTRPMSLIDLTAAAKAPPTSSVPFVAFEFAQKSSRYPPQHRGSACHRSSRCISAALWSREVKEKKDGAATKRAREKSLAARIQTEETSAVVDEPFNPPSEGLEPRNKTGQRGFSL